MNDESQVVIAEEQVEEKKPVEPKILTRREALYEGQLRAWAMFPELPLKQRKKLAKEYADGVLARQKKEAA